MNVNFESIIRGPKKTIFFIGTKCKIHFIYIGFNCKRKKWAKNGQKMSGKSAIGGGRRGGDRRLLAKVSNFVFFWKGSLRTNHFIHDPLLNLSDFWFQERTGERQVLEHEQCKEELELNLELNIYVIL